MFRAIAAAVTAPTELAEIDPLGAQLLVAAHCAKNKCPLARRSSKQLADWTGPISLSERRSIGEILAKKLFRRRGKMRCCHLPAGA